jgi:hypothetical protein
MKKPFGLVLGLSLILPLTIASPASSNPGSEGVFDPCFAGSDTLTGLVFRNVGSSDLRQSWDNTSWNKTDVLVRKSGQVFRASRYSGQSGFYSEQTDNYQSNRITYNLDTGEKQVESTVGSSRYFTEYAYERVVGWLLDDNGNNVRRSSFTIRSGNTDSDYSGLRSSTVSLSRDCSGGGFGSSGGVFPLSGQVNELEVDNETAKTFFVAALSGSGSQNVSIEIEADTVEGAAKILTWNDPYSTENQLGFASLGFSAVDEDGKAVKLLKPIKVSYQSVESGELAYSTDAKDWEWLKSTETPLGLNGRVTKLDATSFSIDSMSGQGWIFIGQKTEQKSPVLYANRFSTAVGSKIQLTTTSGSGKGGVTVVSQTESVCRVSSDKALTGVSKGVCRATATKAGFDGYMDSVTQVIRLEIGG